MIVIIKELPLNSNIQLYDGQRLHLISESDQTIAKNTKEHWSLISVITMRMMANLKCSALSHHIYHIDVLITILFFGSIIAVINNNKVFVIRDEDIIKSILLYIFANLWIT